MNKGIIRLKKTAKLILNCGFRLICRFVTCNVTHARTQKKAIVHDLGLWIVGQPTSAPTPLAPIKINGFIVIIPVFITQACRTLQLLLCSWFEMKPKLEKKRKKRNPDTTNKSRMCL